eukprot:6200100-Pleurochrysis_carterae.AAC.2
MSGVRPREHLVGVKFPSALVFNVLALFQAPTFALFSCGVAIKVGLFAVLWLHHVFVVSEHLPASFGVDVAYQERTVVVERMRLDICQSHAGRSRIGAVAHVAVVVCTVREAPHLSAWRQRLRLLTCSSAREIGIVEYSIATRSKSVLESQRRELLDAAQSKDCVGVVVSRLGCHRLAFRPAIRVLGVVDVDRLAPGLVITELQVGPYIHERDQFVAFAHDQIVCIATVPERLWDRDVISWLAVDRLIRPEAASTFVRVESVVPLRQRIVIAVVGRTFIFGVEWLAGQFSLAFRQCQFALVLRLELLGSERNWHGRNARIAANAERSANLDRARL